MFLYVAIIRVTNLGTVLNENPKMSNKRNEM